MNRCLSVAILLAIASSAFAQREFGFDNTKASGQPYLKPEESVARMKVADGFEVKLFAAEPDVINPIAMTVDEKGRVWVVECFEYPKRTAKGKMPRDRIKILEDTDGDGVCDKVTTFIEGKDFPVPFDLASGIEVGNGGVYLGAPPYLLFIENKNDKPGKIEILLKGFGSQDTHETLNTFQWGPDGRLYGLHGVFTQSEVQSPGANAPGLSPVKMNAAVWRYDTKTKKFEVFAEGTSNPWGMDWRNTDGQFILCCCVIPHLFHMVPGGNYKRQGGLPSNPYAYGEIKEICDHTFHKESGWAHAGLISLDTPLMPEKYRNSVIFGSIHGCSLKQNILKPNGSSFTASRGDDFLVSGDKNFRPINLRWGPNGEIYCIDWHDQNPCHQAKPEDLDYERGRVYRIQPKGLVTKKAEDLGKKSDKELVHVVEDSNPYLNRTALRLIYERGKEFDRNAVGRRWAIGTDELEGKKLREIAVRMASLGANGGSVTNLSKLSDEEYQKMVNAFAFSLTGEEFNKDDFKPSDDLNSQFFKILLSSQIRAIAEAGKLDPRILSQLFPNIANTRSPELRRELSSAAIRVDGDNAPLIKALLKHKEDAADPNIPQLLWVAYEPGLAKNPKDELAWLKDNAAGNALITDTIVPRSMRRLIATGRREDVGLCVEFIGNLTESAPRAKALEAMVAAIGNRTVDAPHEWTAARDKLAMDTNADVKRLTSSLAIKFQDAEAIHRAMAVAGNKDKSTAERAAAVRDLSVLRSPGTVPFLLELVRGKEENELKVEAVRALGGIDQTTISRDLLNEWAKLSPPLRNEIVQILAARKDWATDLLAAVGSNKVDRRDLNDNTILRIQALKDNKLNAQVEKVWGRMRATPVELNQLIDKMRGELAAAPGSFNRGKVVFDNQCAKCHKFDGRGSEVGPSIEGAGRDIEYLLVNVLDPNRVIGAPFFMRTVNLLNGRVETGVLHAEDDQSITLKTENAVLKQIQKKDIDDIKVQEKSLMPEGLSNAMTVQDFRDLVRYVMLNPFITDVVLEIAPATGDKVAVKPVVGVNGRIMLPDMKSARVSVDAIVIAPDNMKVRLLVGSKADYIVSVNDNAAVPGKGSNAAAQPDQTAIEVTLRKGENRLRFVSKYEGKGEAVFMRFHDPDRKLRYPDVEVPVKK
jgi:putative membrane-bound dehydrogenase-like protein